MTARALPVTVHMLTFTSAAWAILEHSHGQVWARMAIWAHVAGIKQLARSRSSRAHADGASLRAFARGMNALTRASISAGKRRALFAPSPAPRRAKGALQPASSIALVAEVVRTAPAACEDGVRANRLAREARGRRHRHGVRRGMRAGGIWPGALRRQLVVRSLQA